MPITELDELMEKPMFWDGFDAEVERQMLIEEQREFWKIIIIYQTPIRLDAPRLAKIAERAFGHSFEVIPGEMDPVDASFLPSERSDPVVAGAPPVLLCSNPPYLLGINVFSLDGSESKDDEINKGSDSEDEALAFMEIELLPHVAEEKSFIKNGYSITGKLAAEFLNKNSSMVLFPEQDQEFRASLEVKKALQSNNPRKSLKF